MSHYVVTGSATADGGPIYLSPAGSQSPAGSWSRRVEDAARLDQATARERASEAHAVAQAIVCDPYVIPVSTEGGRLRPTSLKERIRAEGPSIHFGVDV